MYYLTQSFNQNWLLNMSQDRLPKYRSNINTCQLAFTKNVS